MLEFRVGDVISIDVWGVVQHVGIVSDVGTVISNSMRHNGVVEQSFEEFSGGKAVRYVGYPGALSPQEVVFRARSRLGESWALLGWNCEHFAHWAHGLEPKSPQAVGAITATALAAGAFFIAKRAS